MAVVHSSKMNFAEVVQDMLEKQYYPNVVETTTEVINEVSKEAVKKLKQTAPRGRTGKYSRGWTSRVEKTTTTAESTIYGKTGTYQLAHLLEHGHARRGGGRNVDGIVHIKPVEEWAISEVEKKIREKVER